MSSTSRSARRHGAPADLVPDPPRGMRRRAAVRIVGSIAACGLILLVSWLVPACGGSGSGSTTAVTVALGTTVGSAALDSLLPPGTAPPGALSMRVRALDSAGAVLAGPVTLNGPPFTLDVLVPTSAGVIFEVILFDGLDGTGQPLFIGLSAPQNLQGVPITVQVNMNLYIAIVANATTVLPGGSVALQGFVSSAIPPATSPLLWSATDGVFTETGSDGASATWAAPATLGPVTITAQIDPAQNPDQDPTSVGTVTITVAAQVEDTTPPAFTLLGIDPMHLVQHSLFTDPGTQAIDLVDGDITQLVQTTGAVDTSVLGTYVLSYAVSDNSGNTATLTRTVIIETADVIDFAAAVSEAAGTTPWCLAIEDIDHDGALDLAVGNANATDVTVEWGDGTGTFVGEAVDVGTSTVAIAAADVDHDGEVDLAITSLADGSIRVRWGPLRTPGSFYDVLASTTSPYGLAVADVDHDGSPDVAVSDRDAGDAVLLWGTPSGVFTSTATATAGSPYGVSIADLDDDGSLDMVVSEDAYDTVTILWGDGAGGSSQSYEPVGAGPVAAAVGDLDHDGTLDIAVATMGAPALTVLWGLGSRTFVGSTLPLDAPPADVAIGDLDRDGELDLFAPLPDANAVAVFSGIGNQTLLFEGNFGAGQRPIAVRAGDLDGDGRLDLAVANSGSDDVSILFGASAVGTVLDFGPPAYFPYVGAVPNTTSQDPLPPLWLADLDHDGNADLLNLSYTSPDKDFTTLPGDGAGGFGPAAVVPGSVQTDHPSLGDIDHDGALDLVSVEEVKPGKMDYAIEIFLGDGAGGFQPPLALPLPPNVSPDTTVLGDFDHDGNLDLGIYTWDTSVNPYPRSILLAFGDGAGGFGPIVSTAPSIPLAPKGIGGNKLVVADMDHDGNLDVIVPDVISVGGTPQLQFKVFAGDGTRSGSGFTWLSTINVTQLSWFKVADVDQDGNVDILSTDQGLLTLFRGDGSGGFSPMPIGAQAPFGQSFYDGAIADLNRDGSLDIAMTGRLDYVLIHLGDGAGGFLAAQQFFIDTDPANGADVLATGDVDHDGIPDLVVGSSIGTFGNNARAVVLLGQ